MFGEFFHDIRERSAEDSMWAERGTSNMRKERITHWGTLELVLFTEYYYDTELRGYEEGQKCIMLQGDKNALKV